MSLYTVRPASDETDLIAIVDDSSYVIARGMQIVIEEICETCHRQGVIYRLHTEKEEHRGSPHFVPWKPTPEWHRSAADLLEAKLATELEVPA